jgi:hypothetical protein
MAMMGLGSVPHTLTTFGLIPEKLALKSIKHYVKDKNAK